MIAQPHPMLSFRGVLGLGLERDRWFSAENPLSVFAEGAETNGRIEA